MKFRDSEGDGVRGCRIIPIFMPPARSPGGGGRRSLGRTWWIPRKRPNRAAGPMVPEIEAIHGLADFLARQRVLASCSGKGAHPAA
jgi:hypothetical protein